MEGVLRLLFLFGIPPAPSLPTILVLSLLRAQPNLSGSVLILMGELVLMIWLDSFRSISGDHNQRGSPGHRRASLLGQMDRLLAIHLCRQEGLNGILVQLFDHDGVRSGIGGWRCRALPGSGVGIWPAGDIATAGNVETG